MVLKKAPLKDEIEKSPKWSRDKKAYGSWTSGYGHAETQEILARCMYVRNTRDSARRSGLDEMRGLVYEFHDKSYITLISLQSA